MRVPSVDEQFAIEEGRYRFFVTITFPDTTTMRIDEDKIWDDGFEIDRSVSGQNTFELGACVVGQFKLTLNNVYGDFDNVAFYGAVAEPCVEFYGIPDWKIYGTWSFGLFNVDEIDSNNTFVKLTCLDNMAKFDIPLTSITYPTIGGEPRFPWTYIQLKDCICNAAGVVCGVSNTDLGAMVRAAKNINTSNYSISYEPNEVDSLSCRDALATMCAALGAYAYIDYSGQLQFKPFDKDWLMVEAYTIPPEYDNYPHHMLDISKMTKFSRDEDDIQITGVTIADYLSGAETTCGTGGYVVRIENNWCANGGYAEGLYLNVMNAVILLDHYCPRFRPFKATHLADMTMEIADNVLIEDEFGNIYKSFIMHSVFRARGLQDSECVAEPGVIANAARYTESAKAVAKMNASLLPYNDENTQLGATNTQAAIEAVNTKANNAASAASALIGDPSYTSGGTVAAATGTWKAVQSVQLTAGIWLVEYGMSFASNANGYRAITFNTSSSSASITRNALTAAAVSGEATVMQGSVTLLLTETTTHYLWAYQDSGSSLNTYPFIRVTKLK